MGKDIINPSSLAKPVGFSHGIMTTGGHLLFLAGQTGSDAEGRITEPSNVVAQYKQIMRNLQTVVLSAGGTMEDITKLTIFVRDRDDYMAHLKALGEVHRAFFGSYYPAMALFEISRFFQDDALIEIEGMAVIE
ncbi:MAG TPA: Rid family hydrolase [Ktedonobacteraceae bacterium]|nr:Rid family hydrolase [Ktedonobacteraceae bacterium]